MNEMKGQEQGIVSPDQIMELAICFQRSRILLTAFQLEIFTILGQGNKSSEEVATSMGTDIRATDRLLNALCSMGLMEKKDDHFSNTPITSRFLVKSGPNYMGGLMHMVHLWDTWSTLTQAVKKGKSVFSGHIKEKDESWLSAFISAMHERASRHAPHVASLLDLSGVFRILDVGGGSGAYSMAFVETNENARATVFDLVNVIPLTRKYIKEGGLSHKVETAAGDYNKDAFGSGFDMVFLSAIIHINSYDKNLFLISKASQALNPGGQVVVQDFIMDEDRTSPSFGAMFSLNMLVGTLEGDTYTESEVRTWMDKAGLRDIERKDTSVGTSLIIGKKPV
ncbi:MAG: methyltransferase [Thermodesulfobacteriota bacterium]|nr:methyltransferase [Thermodesulfobacteriota bacterium]